MSVKIVFVAALALLLAACATQRPRALPQVPAAQAEQMQAQREQVLRAQKQWGFSGRVAVSNGKDGGSGRIDWRQDGADFSVQLGAPVTRQSWRLSEAHGVATLDGLEGGTRRGRDASLLVRQATGWEIPLAQLSDWVRGLRGKPVGGEGAAQVEYDAQGRLVHMQQAGWSIDYQWPQAAGDGALPRRVDAVRGQAKVKLLVDQWQAGAGQ